MQLHGESEISEMIKIITSTIKIGSTDNRTQTAWEALH